MNGLQQQHAAAASADTQTAELLQKGGALVVVENDAGLGEGVNRGGLDLEIVTVEAQAVVPEAAAAAAPASRSASSRCALYIPGGRALARMSARQPASMQCNDATEMPPRGL